MSRAAAATEKIATRCTVVHTGHAFSLRALAHAQGEVTDRFLWAALRAVQEKEAILRRAADAQDPGDGAASALAEADALHVFAGQIRSLVVDVPSEESEPMKTP